MDNPDVEVLVGITEGFWINFDYNKICTSAKCNLLLAEENPEVVTV